LTHTIRHPTTAQEFLVLRINQTRVWHYLSGLVGAMNEHAALQQERLYSLETQVAELRAALALASTQVW
jgi:hypothetical protein